MEKWEKKNISKDTFDMPNISQWSMGGVKIFSKETIPSETASCKIVCAKVYKLCFHNDF